MKMNANDVCDACGTEPAAVLVVEPTRRGLAAHMCKQCARAALRTDPDLHTYGLID